MYLRRLGVANFRCYRRLELTLPLGRIVVTGGNAAGKSSLLEAIHLLATTRSPHAGSERELLSWDAVDEVMPFCRVWGEVVRGGETDTLEVVSVRQSEDPAENRLVKRTRVNNAARRAIDAIGVLNVVLFTPRDLEIVDGPPTARRRYLDVLRCQIDAEYCRALARYNKVLVQRNHLLRRLRDRGGDRGELAFWDERLAGDGAVLIQRRVMTIRALDGIARSVHQELTGLEEPLGITYHGLLDPGRPPARQIRLGFLAEEGAGYQGPEERGELEHLFRSSLLERRDESIARGVTVVGPHRDDLSFTVGSADMRVYGSRGQQRTVALALKLAEAQLMWRETGERPVLLLDDVLSELDAGRRSHLLGHIDIHQQSLLTTTEVDRVAPDFLADALVLTVDAARIVEARRDGRVVTPPVE